ncbi:hypothetical protein F7725_009875 [Dissostichus mawsoni]|uniref:Uncharacterized protein n=1 Tax=Dissostichus mawsoni TaxID=36200 RepID=A0A7J5XND4_DISMA|nr:hypothetical protein F7725_009875 [Dissostichus mawsoni]
MTWGVRVRGGKAEDGAEMKGMLLPASQTRQMMHGQMALDTAAIFTSVSSYNNLAPDQQIPHHRTNTTVAPESLGGRQQSVSLLVSGSCPGTQPVVCSVSPWMRDRADTTKHMHAHDQTTSLFLAMFPCPSSTSTPFSVKDILNLEQSHDVMVSPLDVSSRMDCCSVPTSSSSSSSSSSCMLARLKQEPLRDMSSAISMFGEDLQEPRAGRGNGLNFATTFYGKSLLEMDLVKDGKSDAFEGKRRKGEMRKAGTFYCAVLRYKCKRQRQDQSLEMVSLPPPRRVSVPVLVRDGKPCLAADTGSYNPSYSMGHINHFTYNNYPAFSNYTSPGCNTNYACNYPAATMQTMQGSSNNGNYMNFGVGDLNNVQNTFSSSNGVSSLHGIRTW